jgi:hypothetical protein
VESETSYLADFSFLIGIYGLVNMDDFVKDLLTEWGFSELIESFEGKYMQFIMLLA